MRQRIYSVIKDQSDTVFGRVFTVVMSLLIIVNVIFVLVDTLSHEPTFLADASRGVEVGSVSIFTLEYLLRLWTADFIYPSLGPAKARLRYVRSSMAIIDLLSILPFYLPAVIPMDLRILRVLRLVRLVRVFKLGRYSSALETIGRVLKRSAAALVSAVSIVVLLLIVSSVLMYYAENDAQPLKFTSAFSGLWWAMTTITTVGYGDLAPVTVLGQVFGAIIELLGVALVAIPTGIISAGFISELSDEQAGQAADTSTKVGELTKLKVLLDDGLLTRQEFDDLKKQTLMGSVTSGNSEEPL
ncbi:MAG: ion transporter [Propionibacteriaceae bacterium]|nr:ion transporter [Propionibacteriaceae bacterium]